MNLKAQDIIVLEVYRNEIKDQRGYLMSQYEILTQHVPGVPGADCRKMRYHALRKFLAERGWRLLYTAPDTTLANIIRIVLVKQQHIAEIDANRNLQASVRYTVSRILQDRKQVA